LSTVASGDRRTLLFIPSRCCNASGTISDKDWCAVQTASGAKVVTKYHIRKWSQNVTEKSDAMDVKEGVFTFDDPKKVAGSLKHSV
jgi:hypothetical protein